MKTRREKLIMKKIILIALAIVYAAIGLITYFNETALSTALIFAGIVTVPYFLLYKSIK